METCPKRPPVAVTLAAVALAAVAGAYIGRKIASRAIWVNNADEQNIKITTGGGTWNYNTQTGKLNRLVNV